MAIAEITFQRDRLAVHDVARAEVDKARLRHRHIDLPSSGIGAYELGMMYPFGIYGPFW
ncbi:MAG: hypothetical protein QHD01_34845 [Bradyrhizobium sp.]|uniref:hypothetical protein n=1 Tax=Bradyrhizobium sp. TaxID=376 RepID=UPI0029BA6D3F|nr:hypothetical protein [Bradyrhizobium sp.]MDX3971751.1 hypothetical protein [Bradyrhizobium sp.]